MPEAPPSTPSSSWCDPQTGVTDEVTFLDHDRSRILAFLHRPRANSVQGCALLCSSLYEDLELNSRTELLLARAMAARGIAVARFHYRGTGNSDDAPGGAITWQSMVADAHTAMSWLVARTATRNLYFCGFRLGSLVAAELARREERAPLILWSPSLSGAEYYRGLSRASRVLGIRTDPHRQRSGDGGEKQFSEHGAVEMLGNIVHRTSFEDLRTRSLPTDVGSGRRVLLVDVGLADVTPSYQALTAGWSNGGALVDVLKVRTRQLWMVPDVWEPPEINPTTQEVIAGISGWASGVASERL
jgi:alpha/beta superfamily hydrolase